MTKEYLRLTWIAAIDSVINAIKEYVTGHGNSVSISEIVTFERVDGDERQSITFKKINWFKTEADDGRLVVDYEVYYENSGETEEYTDAIEQFSMDEMCFMMQNIIEG